MPNTADVVVAGAGHNSLVAAAYLTKAGYSCLVLDARAIPGGGAATEELLGPGYKVDTCSTGHTMIRVNPLLLRDELGLVADYGLRYAEPDPIAHVVFPDGEQLTQWLDLDRSCGEIARFSKRDADAYRRLVTEYEEIVGVVGRARLRPHGFGPSLQADVLAHPRGRIWLRRAALSAWDLIRREFEDRHVRAYMAWQALQTGVPLDAGGTGMNAYGIVAARQRRSWSIPIGGSATLTNALTGYITDHGGTILCDSRVSRLVIEDGRCTGVETDDGARYLAGRAVLSTIHVKHLVDMAPDEAWGEEFRYGVDTYDVGVSGMAAYYATDAAPEFQTPNGPIAAASAGVAGWAEDNVEFGRAVRDRRPFDNGGVPWLLVATPTLVDPGRAPEGHHTLKLMCGVTWELPAGVSDWEEHKHTLAQRNLDHVRRFVPGLSEEHILASLVKGPDDFERANPHMIHGAFHGGDRTSAFSGPNRPVPGWADHRMPIPGLYQTGGTTSVGGSITGVPGRCAAQVMLTDLGTEPADVMLVV